MQPLMTMMSKDDMFPETLKWNLPLDQEDLKPSNVKEEPEELWPVQGEPAEEHNANNWPFTVVIVKSENEDNPLLHQDQSSEASPPASGSMKEDYGEPQLISTFGPCSSLQPDTDGRSSDCSGNKMKTTSDRTSVNGSRSKSAKYLFNCSECGRTFGRINASKQHKRSQTCEGPFMCHACAERCSLTRRAHGHPAERNPEEPPERSQRGKRCLQNTKGARDKSFICTECGKGFGRKGHLSTHMRIHTGEKPFLCSECGKSFRQKDGLNSHMKIHTGEKSYVCCECGKTFRHRSNLMLHTRNHTGDKPFGCSVCGIRFGQKGHLSSHMRTHTGEKTFLCSECGKGFSRKGHLNRHVKIHTGEKPFGCSECDKRFRQKDALTSHMRSHTGAKPYGCSECGKRFGQKNTLNTHMKIHTGEKSFGCSECGKRFRHKVSLSIHKRIHTRENQPASKDCGISFIAESQTTNEAYSLKK